MPKYRTKPRNGSAASASNRLTSALRLSLASGLAVASGLAIPASTYAQAAATGIVTGRVQNAASGKYLNNARVTVVGTQVQGFTDEYGEFQLNDVPAGSYKLKIFYTGLDAKEVDINVRAGEILAKDITLTSVDAYGTADDTVQLEAFVVNQGKEREAAALAINEQRFAGNIKSVVSTDAFGDIAEGNVGEFLKYIPGITIDYVAADARSAGLNGLDPTFTTVSFNGNRLASAASGGTNRTFEFESATISSASRIEVTKLPTPEQSAEGLAGSINLVPKNAFEYAKAKLTVNGYLGMHSEEFHLHKSGGIGNEKAYKALPNLSFNYVNPLTKNLGFTISGQSSNQFTDQHRTAPTWNWGQGGGSVTNPVMTNYTLQDGPKISFREGLSGRVDWRFAPGHTISVSAGTNYYSSEFNNRNINWITNITSTMKLPDGTIVPLEPLPSSSSVTVTNGALGSHSPTYTQSTTGRANVTQGQSFRKKITVTNNVDLNYKFKTRLWEGEGSLYTSKSRGEYPLQNFESMVVRMVNPDSTSATNTNVTVRMESDGSPFPHPDRLLSYGTAGTPVDAFDLSNYYVASARIRPLKGTDSFTGISGKLKRDLDFLPFYSSLKIGGEIRQQVRDVHAWQQDMDFVGINGSKSAAPFLDTSYLGEDNGFGFSNIGWASPYIAWDMYQADPSIFVSSTSQLINARKFYLQNSQRIQETVSALFIQHELKLVNNRLNVVYGVRYEKTKDEGEGLLTSNAPDGKVDTLDEVNDYWSERAKTTTKDYDGYYPSINANFSITDDTIVRAGFAKTFGRPNFGSIIPLTRYNETAATVNDGIGNIDPYDANVRNPGLKPYGAKNYDLTVEHYLPKAGLISARGFIKDIDNFFYSLKRDLIMEDFTYYGIPTEYAAAMIAGGGQISTTVNSADSARLSGIELTYRIAQLPYIPVSFGRAGFFVSYTNQHTSGAGARNFTNFAPRLANARLDYHIGKLSATVGWNYTSERRTSDLTGANVGGAINGFSSYIPERSTIDVSADYQIDKRWSVFANARNVFNEANSIVENVSDLSPAYSEVGRYEEYGVLINLGVKAAF
jgi:TonB-dependent receptor